jgi:hypothetical protein
VTKKPSARFVIEESAPADSDDAQLLGVIDQLGEHAGAMMWVYRVEQGGRPRLCAKIAPADFDLEGFARDYGAGEYVARFYQRGAVGPVAPPVNFGIDRVFGAGALAAKTASAPREGANSDRLFEMMMAMQQQASAQMAQVLVALISRERQGTDPLIVELVKSRNSTTELAGIVELAKSLGENTGGGDDAITAAIKALPAALPAIAELAKSQQQPARRPMPRPGPRPNPRSTPPTTLPPGAPSPTAHDPRLDAPRGGGVAPVGPQPENFGFGASAMASEGIAPGHGTPQTAPLSEGLIGQEVPPPTSEAAPSPEAAIARIRALFQPALTQSAPSPFAYAHMLVQAFGEHTVAGIVQSNDADAIVATILGSAPELEPLSAFIARVVYILEGEYGLDDDQAESAPQEASAA